MAVSTKGQTGSQNNTNANTAANFNLKKKSKIVQSSSITPMMKSSAVNKNDNNPV